MSKALLKTWNGIVRTEVRDGEGLVSGAPLVYKFELCNTMSDGKSQSVLKTIKRTLLKTTQI